MVNQCASTATRQVTIFLNLEYYNPKHSRSLLETAISITYSYICELSSKGIASAVFTNGRDRLSGDPVVFDMDTSYNDIGRRGIELARIDLDQDVLPFEALIEEYLSSTGTDDFIVVISPRRDDAFKVMIQDLQALRKNSTWVIPCYRDYKEIPGDIRGVMRWEVSGHD